MFTREIYDWALDIIRNAESRRDWGALPSDYEAAAVARVFVTLKPHMDKKAIRARIAASKVRTFLDLRTTLNMRAPV